MMVVRGGVEPPTFRFSGTGPSPACSDSTFRPELSVVLDRSGATRISARRTSCGSGPVRRPRVKPGKITRLGIGASRTDGGKLSSIRYKRHLRLMTLQLGQLGYHSSVCPQ
jgi:hypothetical protein